MADYKELREKYRITEQDMMKMNELRRKWAFDDVMAELACGAYDDLDPMPTSEQIERIIDEYIELRVFDRDDWELEQENMDMEAAFDKVLFVKEEK